MSARKLTFHPSFPSPRVGPGSRAAKPRAQARLPLTPARLAAPHWKRRLMKQPLHQRLGADLPSLPCDGKTRDSAAARRGRTAATRATPTRRSRRRATAAGLACSLLQAIALPARGPARSAPVGWRRDSGREAGLDAIAAYGELAEHLRRIGGAGAGGRAPELGPGDADAPEGRGAAGRAGRRGRGGDPRARERPADRRTGSRRRGRSNGAGAVNLAEAARLHARAVKVPARLAAELARAAVEAQTAWEAARAASDFKAFVPYLERMVRLKRSEADCLAAGGRSGLRRAPRRLRARDDGGGARAAVRPAAAGAGGAARPHRRGAAAGAGAGGALPRGSADAAVAPARRRLRLRLGGGAARHRDASVVVGLGRRRADHHPHRRGRSARVHLFDDPRGRARGLRAGARPDAGAAAGGGARLDGGARIAVAAVREPDRAQPGLLPLAVAGAALGLRRAAASTAPTGSTARSTRSTAASSAPRRTRCTTTCT